MLALAGFQVLHHHKHVSNLEDKIADRVKKASHPYCRRGTRAGVDCSVRSNCDECPLLTPPPARPAEVIEESLEDLKTEMASLIAQSVR